LEEVAFNPGSSRMGKVSLEDSVMCRKASGIQWVLNKRQQ
jgi:hypothetical protein